MDESNPLGLRISIFGNTLQDGQIDSFGDRAHEQAIDGAARAQAEFET